ncbi:MAG: HAMP domain-containing histidine kinase [Alphaproteobacteria bacterium]|nr:HAMP domain-containing histidine kinase [Alphaproteobacteria bacterium]
MQLPNDRRLILTPLLLGAGLFFLTFIAFTTPYIFFEYRDYLSVYQTNQKTELKVLQKKADAIFKKVDELLQLNGTRIAASRDNLQRIQNILVSAPRLYTPQELPNIQSMSYYIFSKPYKIVSRFGVFPHAKPEPPIPHVSPKESSIGFQDDSIVSKIPVFDEKQTLNGVLEIRMSFPDFKTFLGSMRTLSYTPFLSSQESLLLQKVPVALYEKPPDPFCEFAFNHQKRYAIFLFYTLLVFSLFICSVFLLFWYFQRKYRGKFKGLEQCLEKAADEGEEFKERLIISEQKYKFCWKSYQCYKKIHANLNNEKREQALQICKGLDAVTQGIKGSKMLYSTAQQFELLQYCSKFARDLSEGRILQKKVEEISFINLFEEVSALFAEKMYKSKITLEITSPDDLLFHGDPLFTELIFMNVIGKAIYRLSRNGKVSITALDQEETIALELRDKGYPSDNESEKAFKKAVDLFISENILKKMCHENDIQYISLREKDFNITKIIIPKFPLENSEGNIVKLFQ